MLSRWLTLVVWALVAGSGVYWGAKLLARPLPVPAQAAVAVAAPVAGGDLTRLFGAAPVQAPAAPVEQAPAAPAVSRFELLGVVAASPAAARTQGVALIAVDGKIARAFRVGARVDGDLVLQSVQPREVKLGPRGSAAQVSLELQPLPPAATGVPQPAAGGSPSPAAMSAPAAGVPGAAPFPATPALTLPRGGTRAGSPLLPLAPLPQPANPAPQALPAPPLLNAPGYIRQRGVRPLSNSGGVLPVPGAQAEEAEAPEQTAPHDSRALR